MTSDPSASFGELLRRARQAAGLTQEELAERAGLSRRGIADLEGGARRRPRKDTAALLAAALGLAGEDRAAFEAAARHGMQRPASSAHSPPLAVPGEAILSARALPSGTVTFLFTDLEGSTRLLQQLGTERYTQALATLRRLLRAALGWALERGASDHALRVVGAIAYFWLVRGYMSEGQKWVGEALAGAEHAQGEKAAPSDTLPGAAARAHRAKALHAAAWFQFVTFDPKAARALVAEELRVWRELRDKRWIAMSLELEALLMSYQAESQPALACLEEGVELARQTEDSWVLAICLIRFGRALKPQGKAAAGRWRVGLATACCSARVCANWARSITPMATLRSPHP
jgi:transcriptional regulator with XRE-family HTH domain